MGTEVKTHVIHFTVDDEPLATTEANLTVRQILGLAHLDVATHYLVEIRGNHQEKHTNLDEALHLNEKEKFISVFTGPTPVS